MAYLENQARNGNEQGWQHRSLNHKLQLALHVGYLKITECSSEWETGASGNDSGGGRGRGEKENGFSPSPFLTVPLPLRRRFRPPHDLPLGLPGWLAADYTTWLAAENIGTHGVHEAICKESMRGE